MKKRRFSITQQQAESICVAIAVAESAIAEATAKAPVHSPYFDMRRTEWDAISTRLSSYQWETQ